jgi:hypothetical protein
MFWGLLRIPRATRDGRSGSGAGRRRGFVATLSCQFSSGLRSRLFIGMSARAPRAAHRPTNRLRAPAKSASQERQIEARGAGRGLRGRGSRVLSSCAMLTDSRPLVVLAGAHRKHKSGSGPLCRADAAHRHDQCPGRHPADPHPSRTPGHAGRPAAPVRRVDGGRRAASTPFCHPAARQQGPWA